MVFIEAEHALIRINNYQRYFSICSRRVNIVMSTILHHGSILHSVSLLVMLSKSSPWLDIRAIVEGMMHRINVQSPVWLLCIMRKKFDLLIKIATYTLCTF
jgi:hypothetical protein